MLTASQESYAQLPQYNPQFASPSTPFPFKYNTVAASTTGQALTGGGGGATGDYLQSCLVIPTSTSPVGGVTILDNSTSIVIFAGGASSLPNLMPFTIQIGAASKNGAWKVTTGTLLSVVCTGNFT
jgi:hypothetical protein